MELDLKSRADLAEVLGRGEKLLPRSAIRPARRGPRCSLSSSQMAGTGNGGSGADVRSRFWMMFICCTELRVSLLLQTFSIRLTF